MDIVFYTILFIVGIVVGSIWAERVDEIPKELDMRETQYSDKKRRGLISELIYIILGGLSSVIIANVLKMNMQEIDIVKVIIYIFTMIYISTLVIIAGIDRNYTKINKNMIAFGTIASILYMLYLCVIEVSSISANIMHLAILMILLVIDSFLLRKYAKDSYIINVLLLLMIIYVFTNFEILGYTIIMAAIACMLYILSIKSRQKRNGNKKVKMNEIPVGYFIASSNIIILFMLKVLESYWM